MARLTREKFERIVSLGIAAIPERFLKKIENVAVVVEDEPTTEQKKKLKTGKGYFLLGLYEGVPRDRRSAGYAGVLPDKITIFQKAIETMARDEGEIREIVKNTVWHEIAHHFGMGEERVRQAEARRRSRQDNQ